MAMHVGDGLTVAALQDGPMGVLVALPVDLLGEVQLNGSRKWAAAGLTTIHTHGLVVVGISYALSATGWTHNERGAEHLASVPLGRCAFLQWQASVTWDAERQRFEGRLMTTWCVTWSFYAHA